MDGAVLAPDTISDLASRLLSERLAGNLETFAFAALDGLPFGISIIDRDMRILFVNRRQQSFFPGRKLVGETCYRAYMNDPNCDETCPWCAASVAIKTGKVVRKIAPSRDERGVVFDHFEVIAVPLRDGAGQVFAIMELVQDIADRAFKVPLTLEPSEPRNLSRMFAFDRMVCASEATRNLKRRLEMIFDTDATVLITGETGTGKNLVSNVIHENSSRRSRPFVTLNCANMSETLLESDLFGHERGSFTGAVAAKHGMVETAEGGTIMLDEIGDAPLSIQAKLLRFLETSEFERVGSTKTRSVDVRVLAATNRDLDALMGEGRFREDLYYRLSVITIEVPPLRERPEEIPILAERFLANACRRLGVETKTFHPRVMRLFLDYDWPGNCRQLKHEVEQMAILAKYETVVTEELVSRRIAGAGISVERPAQSKIAPHPQVDSLKSCVEAHEQNVIRDALAAANGNRTLAAKTLGLTRRGLLKKMQRFGIK
jgi:transcriptional regulator with PAS, ATPase and Fis domain